MFFLNKWILNKKKQWQHKSSNTKKSLPARIPVVQVQRKRHNEDIISLDPEPDSSIEEQTADSADPLATSSIEKDSTASVITESSRNKFIIQSF